MPNRDGSLTFDELVQLFGGGGSSLGGGLMQGITPATQQPVEQGVMGAGSHELSHHTGAGVKTYNTSGTNPMMMAGANAVGSGLNSIGLPTNEYSFTEDGNTVSYGFTGDGLTNEAMDAFRNREGITALTPMQLEQEAWLRANQPDSLPAFYQGIRDGKVSQYELENQYRLRM
jgi:hypothetical protein